MAEFVSGRQLRAKRQAARREQQNSNGYISGKVKAAQEQTQKDVEMFPVQNVGDIRTRGLLSGSTLVSTLASPIGDALSAVTPDPVKEKLSQGMEYLAGTDVGQAVSQVMEENPRAARLAGAAMDVGGLIPAARVAQTAVNAGAARVPTMLEGFYGAGAGTPQKLVAAGKGAATALPGTIFDAFSPRAIAYERVTGVPLAKGKGEIGAGTTKGNESMASAITTDYISRQRGKGPAPFIAEGPIGKVNNLAEVPATDTKAVKSQLFEEGVNINFSVPEQVQNRAMAHLYKVWGFKPENTDIVVKNPEGVQRLSNEARVGTKKGPKALRLLTQATVQGEKGLASFMKKKKKTVQEATRSDLVSFYRQRGVEVTEGGKGDPHVYIGTSHVSEAKELGGVNDFIAINADTGDVYSVISDQHDMFGLDPIGGSSLITMTPVQRSNFKAPESERYSMEDNLNSRITKGGKNKPEGDRRAEVMQAAKDLERRSGIPMEKGENPVSYNLRVLREYEPTISARDRASVGRRAGMLTASAQPFIGAPAAADEER
jgi:hypothetical protein